MKILLSDVEFIDYVEKEYNINGRTVRGRSLTLRDNKGVFTLKSENLSKDIKESTFSQYATGELLTLEADPLFKAVTSKPYGEQAPRDIVVPSYRITGILR